MDRTCVNLIGNCLATVVVAGWEGEFDDTRAKVFGTPAEAALDLKEGDVAFAERCPYPSSFILAAVRTRATRLVGFGGRDCKKRQLFTEGGL